MKTTETSLVYIGSYTETLPFVEGKSDGIHLYRLNLSSGELTFVNKTTGLINPAYLAIHPNGKYLYCVNECQNAAGEGDTISAFSIQPETHTLTFLNRQSAHGDCPCHISLDRDGRYVLAANYYSGNLSVYPIRADGRLESASQVVQHEGGSGVNPERQEAAHAHCVVTDSTNRLAFVADLGLDKVMIYQLDLEKGQLTPADPPWVKTRPGAGPRHLAWHPSGNYLFLINELDSTIVVFACNRDAGTLETVDTVSTLPDNFSGNSTCAAIHVSPSGRFVYGSNRGYDTIAAFAFDPASGKLMSAGHASTQGKTPRDFAVDPTETFLLAANQDTDTIVTFRIDSETGQLTPTGHVAEVMTPVCVKFVGEND